MAWDFLEDHSRDKAPSEMPPFIRPDYDPLARQNVSGSPVQPLKERIEKALKDVNYSIVTSHDQRRAVFELRYRAYLREGAILPNAFKFVKDDFDCIPNSATFAVFFRGDLLASIRLCFYRATRRSDSTPARQVFPKEVEERLRPNELLIDPNRFVIDTQRTHSAIEFAFIALRIPLFAGQFHGCDVMTATTRPEHCPFYRKYTKQTKVTEPRDYPSLIKPLCLMTVRFKEEISSVIDKTPSWRFQNDELGKLVASCTPNLPCP